MHELGGSNLRGVMARSGGDEDDNLKIETAEIVVRK